MKNLKPKVEYDFDFGEKSAVAVLEEIGVTYRWCKTGIQLRFGKRGRLTKPEGTLTAAIFALLDEGPKTRVTPVLAELYAALSLSLTEDPENDIFGLIDDALDLASVKEVSEEEPSKTGVVLPFPTNRRKPNV